MGIPLGLSPLPGRQAFSVGTKENESQREDSPGDSESPGEWLKIKPIFSLSGW